MCHVQCSYNCLRLHLLLAHHSSFSSRVMLSCKVHQFLSVLLVPNHQTLVMLKSLLPAWRRTNFLHLLQLHTVHIMETKTNRPTDSSLSKGWRAGRKHKKGGVRWMMSWQWGVGLALCWRCTVQQASVGSVWESCCLFSDLHGCLWSAEPTGGYHMSSVYSATWAQTMESQDVSLRGTIDPTLSVGGKPGRPNHIRPT